MCSLVRLPDAKEREEIVRIYADPHLAFDDDISLQEVVERATRSC